MNGWNNGEFDYCVRDGQAVIQKSYSKGIIEVPKQIDGCPVRELADYVFAAANGKAEPEEIYLPQSIRRIGRYAFYNCTMLRKLSFYTDIADVGAGAFTGCHHVEELDVTVTGDAAACLKEILMELPEKMRVWYRTEEGTAKLLFPEYFEEGVENTPARILETHTHGSGMYYRNCFVQKKLQFSEYDERFSMAEAQEETELLLELVFGRLNYPLMLSEKARGRYQEFLRKHWEKAGLWCLANQDMSGICYLADNCLDSCEKLEWLTEQAIEAKRMEAVSYLQDCRHKKFPLGNKKGRFVL